MANFLVTAVFFPNLDEVCKPSFFHIFPFLPPGTIVSFFVLGYHCLATKNLPKKETTR